MTWVNTGKHCRRIRFTEIGCGCNRGVFRCTDTRLAEAIRKLPLFGRIITEEQRSVEEEIVSDIQKKYTAIYPGITRTQEANRILTEQYGIPRENLKNRSDALKEAERINIFFPNLKQQ